MLRFKLVHHPNPNVNRRSWPQVNWKSLQYNLSCLLLHFTSPPTLVIHMNEWIIGNMGKTGWENLTMVRGKYISTWFSPLLFVSKSQGYFSCLKLFLEAKMTVPLIIYMFLWEVGLKITQTQSRCVEATGQRYFLSSRCLNNCLWDMSMCKTSISMHASQCC